MPLISGLKIKALQTIPDNRGYFREVLRSTDEIFAEGFGQWSHSKLLCNTLKAWHFHHRQVDWWYVAFGVAECAFYDFRKASPTFGQLMQCKLGDPEVDPEALAAVVRIPPGVLHGCKVTTDEACMFYVTSEVYDPQDEGRIPFNSELVPMSWGNERNLIIADNDRRTFIPPYPLKQIF